MKILRIIFPIALIFIIWIIASIFISPVLLPSPINVFNTLIQMLMSGVLLKALAVSFTRITIGTFLAVIVSIPLGLIIINYKWVDFTISSLTGFMRYFPVTAFLTLLIMWIGIGEPLKIVFIFLVTFFYFLPAVILCLKEVNQDLIDTALTMGMSKFKVMYKVLLPAALPSICQNFLMMYALGWTYIIIAEAINAGAGLGFIMNIAGARGQIDIVFVVLIVILIVSIIFDSIGRFLIQKIFKWKFAGQDYGKKRT